MHSNTHLNIANRRHPFIGLRIATRKFNLYFSLLQTSEWNVCVEFERSIVLHKQLFMLLHLMFFTFERIKYF